jgi:hypothetical protein
LIKWVHNQSKNKLYKKTDEMKILRPQKFIWPLLREHQSFCEVIVIQILVLRSTINVYSLFSHEWWVSLIKFMVGLTINVREGSTQLFVFWEY